MKNLTRKKVSSVLDFTDEAEEVRIPVPWGEIAGKWWGPKDVRPILCLHGWQDNAGSFDTLIPLLPKSLSYLALDWPGNGFSSRYPDGLGYHGIDQLGLLQMIRREYKWDKISIIAHSMGSVISFNFCGAFPDDVDMMIGIDALKSHIRKPEYVPAILEIGIQKFLQADEQNRSKSEPPAYTIDDMINRMHDATNGSVTKECCKYLLRRNIAPSKMYPDLYYFTRDNRWKYTFGLYVPQEISIELAKRMRMPYLFLKASNSPYYENKKYFDEMLELMQKYNKNFDWKLIEGTHHLHLTHPESISGIISEFIIKHRIKNETKEDNSKAKL